MATALLAEFADAEGAIRGATRLRELGCKGLNAYTPYAVVELEPLLGIERSRIPIATLVAGMTGALAGLGVIEFCNAYDYPLNVGGRPLHSIPASIPIMFESCVLFAVVTTFLAALVLGGMPRLYDPVFEIEGFERTTTDRYWITVDAAPQLDVGALVAGLDGMGAVRVEALGAEAGGEEP